MTEEKDESLENAAIIVLIAGILILSLNWIFPYSITGFFSATTTPTGDVNVTVRSDVSITITQEDINLGVLAVTDSNATCGVGASPTGNCQLGATATATGGRAVLFENNGNADVNVTAQSSAFFTSTSGMMPSDANKLGCKASFNEGTTAIAQFWAISWWNCYNGATPKIVGCLSKTDSGDQARVDFNVTVPPDEPSGLKQAVVTLTATAC